MIEVKGTVTVEGNHYIVKQIGGTTKIFRKGGGCLLRKIRLSENIYDDRNDKIFFDIIPRKNADIIFLHIKRMLRSGRLVCITCSKNRNKINTEIFFKPCFLSEIEKILENIKEGKTRFFPLFFAEDKNRNRFKGFLFINDNGINLIDFKKGEGFTHITKEYIIDKLPPEKQNKYKDTEKEIIGIFKDEKIPYILTTQKEEKEEGYIIYNTLKFHLYKVNVINDDNAIVEKLFTFEDAEIDSLLDFMSGKQNWFIIFSPEGKEQKMCIQNGKVCQNPLEKNKTGKKTKRVIATTA